MQTDLSSNCSDPYSIVRHPPGLAALARRSDTARSAHVAGVQLTMAAPKPSSDPLYKLLRDEEILAFNKKREPGRVYDFRGCSFRGSDLRGLDAIGLDFRDCYFRDADLRGVDLRQAQLEGASFGSAKISGVFFADEIAAEEIRLSVELGTRLRTRKPSGG
jgi:uncharacterized protein YjbI with pentapeptide repeats